VIAAGTYMVQRHAIDGGVLVASIPIGIAIGAFLWINEFPDARADAAAGKRTLVVRLGRPRAARAFIALTAAAYLAVIALPLLGLPLATWLGLIGLPFGMAAAHRLYRHPEETRHIVPAQAWTLWSFVLMAVGITAGLVIAAST
jgi:1,4-dihydroxy-2-naphthoate octaprenyltransferase